MTASEGAGSGRSGSGHSGSGRSGFGLPRDRIAVALDLPSLDEALALAARVAPHVGVFKVGLELFVRHGPEAVARVRDATDRAVFLDLKLHDIPETVERAVAAARSSGARYLTVHAAGGRAMLAAAAQAAGGDLTLLAVTVLTSLNEADLREAGIDRPLPDHAKALVGLAWDEGVRGFVTSAHEVAALRAERPDALLVTPGIRPDGASQSDQKRVATPGAAIMAGADLLVVGRPIRDSPDPVEAALLLEREVEGAIRVLG